MRARFRGLVWGLALTSLSASAGAEMSATEHARRAQVLAKVGARQVTVGELEDRLATMPQYTRDLYGSTPAEVRRGVLERVLVRQQLLAAEAEASAPDPQLQYELTRSRAGATLREIAKRSSGPNAFSAEQVQAYYDAHPERYRAPLRVYVWRMLLPTRAAAEAALGALGSAATPERWAELCREQSVDEATKLRRGTLGFLAPDGTSSEAGVRVEPAIYQAAAALEDGQLASQPVAEGQQFALVWRRGSTPAKEVPLSQAESEIRRLLAEDAFKAAREAELSRLRGEFLRSSEPSRVEGIKLPVMDPIVVERARTQ